METELHFHYKLPLHQRELRQNAKNALRNSGSWRGASDIDGIDETRCSTARFRAAVACSNRTHFDHLDCFSGHFCFLKNLSEVRMLTTFYLAKNDHRWVAFISLKTIKPDGLRVLVTLGH